MYRALYRKWRPQKFEDVVGQKAVVTALKNQVATGRIGHAYLFTGVRGTGKTTCAKIFAKAVNCLEPHEGDPCDACEICKGIDNGSILDVVEMDAASNNGVDDVRDIRDETAYTPSICKYKVYIIDEVHMLSMPAFNALLKTLEEPPSHVIFILATTEIQKVPATILSRCQRYDFTRIRPEDIAERVAQIAAAEHLNLTPGAAALVARLADGALRDALSILDTCAGVSDTIDEEVVRRMAGVTDKSYLFRISDAVAAGDGGAALAELAALRQQSVDVKRLAEELVSHYRNLMLAGLPNGKSLLSGISPEEETLYLEKSAQVPQAEAIRAIRTIGGAMEKMARGNNHRIELELALFSLTQAPAPIAAPAAAPAVSAPKPFSAAPQAVKPFAAAPQAAVPAPRASAETLVFSEAAKAPAPQPLTEKAQPDALESGPTEEVPPPDDGDAPVSAKEALPWENQPDAPAELPAEALSDEPAAAPTEKTTETLSDEPAAAPTEKTTETLSDEPADAPTAASAAVPAQPGQPAYEADPKLNMPRRTAEAGTQAFPAWPEVIKALEARDMMLYTTLRKSKAYYDGKRVLIDGGKMFRDFIRVNRDSQRLLKKIIAEVTGIACAIGPYEPQANNAPAAANAEQSLEILQQHGLDIVVKDSENGRH
ncbi:MAG: DNA polymerase III subunit gamma/tau [Faecalibacterium sp.]|jgi:DNA polymerase-3 subunit gamma/tau|nr:DNA polymerase III subunit gamma/tau [Faecalibacterium sp.]